LQKDIYKNNLVKYLIPDLTNIVLAYFDNITRLKVSKRLLQHKNRGLPKHSMITFMTPYVIQLNAIHVKELKIRRYGRYKLSCAVGFRTDSGIIDEINEIENDCKILLSNSLYEMDIYKSIVSRSDIITETSIKNLNECVV
jgi:hypothetical protein